MTTVQDIIRLMEKIAPAVLAEAWDNAGLQIGDRNRRVNRIMVSLDPTLDAVKAACDSGADLLITHHPLIFQALKEIDLKTPIGRIISLSIRHKLAIFSAHTNLDSVAGGLNDVLAARLGLRELEILCPLIEADAAGGLGRIGRSAASTDLKGLIHDVRTRLGLERVKVVGDPDLPVEKVAVCTGSGSGLMGHFFRSDARVFISGDLKYHDARDAQMLNRGLIDIGHFASERFMVDMVTSRLEKTLKEEKREVTVKAWMGESDPFRYV